MRLGQAFSNMILEPESVIEIYIPRSPEENLLNREVIRDIFKSKFYLI